MSQKYVVAKNRGVNTFFTKSSAYDKPQWVNESAASVFLSIESAEAAVKKLYRHGAYEARIVPLKEAIELEMPDEPAEQDDKPKMVARVQSTPNELPKYSDEVDADGDSANDAEDFDDPLAALEDDSLDSPEDPDAIEPSVERPEVPLQRSLRRESVEESAEMPARAANNTNDDNADTVANGPKYDKIKYKDSTVDAEPYAAPVAGASKDNVDVPASVKSDLAKAIAQFKEQAADYESTNTTRSSFSLTVVDAFERLQDFLNDGTVDSLKKAQVFMQSWMSTITNNLPSNVQHFVVTGGRKQSLKNLFNTAWDAKRNAQ